MQVSVHLIRTDDKLELAMPLIWLVHLHPSKQTKKKRNCTTASTQLTDNLLLVIGYSDKAPYSKLKQKSFISVLSRNKRLACVLCFFPGCCDAFELAALVCLVSFYCIFY